MSPEVEKKGREWFERVWEHREEVLYPSLFGKARSGIYPVQAQMITETFQQESFDPRWLHYGVIEFAPEPSRNSWLYVTSGMSNDWEGERPDPSTPSGLACEFVLEVPQQSQWAILRLLYLTVFQILLCLGRFPGRKPLGDFDRIPLRCSIRPEPSLLTWLMLAPPARFESQMQLESGAFDFYQVVGISEAEAAYARSHSGEDLLKLLASKAYFPVTNPDRPEVDLGAFR
jgi:hypothetical protein